VTDSFAPTLLPKYTVDTAEAPGGVPAETRCRRLLKLPANTELFAATQDDSAVYVLTGAQHPRFAMGTRFFIDNLRVYRLAIATGDVADLGIYIPDAGVNLDPELRRALRFCTGAYVPLNKGIAVFPIAAAPSRDWLTERFRATASRLWRSTAEHFTWEPYSHNRRPDQAQGSHHDFTEGFLVQCDLKGEQIRLLAASSRKEKRSSLDDRSPWVIQAILPAADPDHLRVLTG